ncbi:MAG: restriction endonuclease subunit S [Thermoguttaceae bacterium]|nr:restriction endonuclease subunit S [Thermoguttaceae bacterium]
MCTFKKIKLADVVDINMGQSPPSTAYNEQGEGLPFYQGNADFGELHPQARVYCSRPVKVANPNELLISVRAPVGAINISDKICCIGRGLAALKPKSGVVLKYLYYTLRHFRPDLENRSVGTTFKSVNKMTLADLGIPLPPLAEQERIAAELDAVAATLKKRQAQLAELNALVEARFIELFGDPATNPKGWPVKILKDCLAEIQSGNREKGGALASGVPSLGAEHINNDGGFNLQPEKLKYIGEEFYSNLKRGKIQIGDVLLVKDGATTGKTGYVTPSFPFEKAAVNEHVFLLRSKPGMTNLFLFYFLRSKVGKERVLGKFHGATIGGITKDFALIEIPLPPLELQERFAAEVERVEALKTTVRAGIAETQTLFDALTQRYFG